MPWLLLMPDAYTDDIESSNLANRFDKFAIAGSCRLHRKRMENLFAVNGLALYLRLLQWDDKMVAEFPPAKSKPTAWLS